MTAIVHWTHAGSSLICSRCGQPFTGAVVAVLRTMRRPEEGVWWSEDGSILSNGHLGTDLALCPLSTDQAARIQETMAAHRAEHQTKAKRQ